MKKIRTVRDAMLEAMLADELSAERDNAQARRDEIKRLQFEVKRHTNLYRDCVKSGFTDAAKNYRNEVVRYERLLDEARAGK